MYVNALYIHTYWKFLNVFCIYKLFIILMIVPSTALIYRSSKTVCSSRVSITDEFACPRRMPTKVMDYYHHDYDTTRLGLNILIKKKIKSCDLTVPKKVCIVCIFSVHGI